VDAPLNIRALELTCAVRDSAGRITHVGGTLSDGTRWAKPLAEVMREMEEDAARYYVRFGAQHAALGIEEHGAERRLACLIDASWTPATLPACPK